MVEAGVEATSEDNDANANAAVKMNVSSNHDDLSCEVIDHTRKTCFSARKGTNDSYNFVTRTNLDSFSAASKSHGGWIMYPIIKVEAEQGNLSERSYPDPVVNEQGR